jgi:TOBE domain
MGRLRKFVLDTAGGQKLIVARQVAGVEAKSFTVGDAVVATFQPEDAVVLQDTHEHKDK